MILQKKKDEYIDILFKNITQNINYEESKSIIENYIVKINPEYENIILLNMFLNKNEELLKLFLLSPIISLRRNCITAMEYKMYFILFLYIFIFIILLFLTSLTVKIEGLVFFIAVDIIFIIDMLRFFIY